MLCGSGLGCARGHRQRGGGGGEVHETICAALIMLPSLPPFYCQLTWRESQSCVLCPAQVGDVLDGTGQAKEAWEEEWFAANISKATLTDCEACPRRFSWHEPWRRQPLICALIRYMHMANRVWPGMGRTTTKCRCRDMYYLLYVRRRNNSDCMSLCPSGG